MIGKLARIKVIVGLLLAATPALAQQLPFSLPANSVVGRTNVTGNSGDAYAIPFSQLVSLLSTYGLVQAPPSAVQGHVAVFGSAPGLLVDGGGVYVDPSNASNITSGTLAAGRMPALTGDVTSSVGTVATTLATVNANVGSFGSATQCVSVTNNAKGLTTAISAATCTPAIGSITGFGTGVATALALNVGSAGAPVLFNGAGGTPSSITLTNGTALPLTGIAAIAADRVVANATGGSASPTAVSIGSCSTASSALTYNTTTHAFGCNTIAAGTAGQLPGTTTNDNATAGNVGEYVTTGTGANNANATVTITIAAPAVVTWTGHGFCFSAAGGACGTTTSAATAIKFTTTGALPTGIVSGTTYYLKAIDANTFNIATTCANALAGTFITTSGTQSGVQTGDIRIGVTSGVQSDVACLSVPSGDWDVGGQMLKAAGATTTVSTLAGNLSLVSASVDRTFGRRLSFQYSNNTFVPTAGEFTVFDFAPARFPFSGATTVFLVADDTFGTSTLISSGWLRARRTR